MGNKYIVSREDVLRALRSKPMDLIELGRASHKSIVPLARVCKQLVDEGVISLVGETGFKTYIIVKE